MQVYPHVDPAAWDMRSVSVRVELDVRTDFGRILGKDPADRRDALNALERAINALEELLRVSPDADEREYQALLEMHPILLDVYAEATPRPRWVYPNGLSPVGKTYIEPDFVLRYPGNMYRLVELERPGKLLVTRSGHPRVDLTQAMFQIAEWRSFIHDHGRQLCTEFPDITATCPGTVVISRTTSRSLAAARDIASYRALLSFQSPNLDILTYDDLAARARQMLASLRMIAGAVG